MAAYVQSAKRAAWPGTTLSLLLQALSVGKTAW